MRAQKRRETFCLKKKERKKWHLFLSKAFCCNTAVSWSRCSPSPSRSSPREARRCLGSARRRVCWLVRRRRYFCSLSFFFFRISSVSSRIGIRFVSPNDARFDTMYIVQKPTGGKLTNQQRRHKKTGIAVAFVSLPLHEMRPYQDKRSMTTEKAAAEQHMKDLAEQEKQFKEGKKKK